MDVKKHISKMNKPYLVIVESPTKQKTISKMLGSEYVVKSSYGHVRDLPQKELGVDEKNNFKPTYKMIPSAKRNISELKAKSKISELLFLATDHDREGESIAWHLVELLSPEPAKVRRITFHEITRSAVLHALENARQIDTRLVEAQQARRVLDRLVGYKLSPLLWSKIGKGLSAGRVQSVAVRLLTERADEIKKFKIEEYWSIEAKLEKENFPPQFQARVIKWQGKKTDKTTTYKLFAEDYRVKTTIFEQIEHTAPVTAAIRKGPLTVSKAESKEIKQGPKPPFITSSLQQKASTKLGFAAQKTMKVAQSLYEGITLDGEDVGLITYMRTDSFNVSKDIQEQSKKFIASEYGKKFLPPKPPFYAKKVKGAQEAHEAIHPTSVFRTPDKMKKYLSKDQSRLYELIWRRFIASQMADAVYQGTTVDIAVGEDKKSPECLLRISGRIIIFDGYLKVYNDKDNDDKEEDIVLPDVNEGDKLCLVDIITKPHKTSPPPVYNEASLIKTLEKHGIGRPSTYAPIIKTIVDRKYVIRQPKVRRLLPTELGVMVTKKLKIFFPEIMNLSYTAGIEEKLDEIAEGNIKWTNVIDEFYGPFTGKLNGAYKKMQPPSPQPSEEKCPICSGPMLVRISRYGKYLSCSQYPKCKGKIPLDSSGEKLIPEKTNEVCNICGKPMVIRHGRRGKFMACSGFPKCKNTYSVDSQGNKVSGSESVKSERKCEKCGSPFILKKSKRGYFLACSGYPKCKNIVTVSEEEVHDMLKKADKLKTSLSSKKTA